MLLQLSGRPGSSGDESASGPLSPNTTAMLEQDLKNIDEQTETLLADKTAAEHRYARSVLHAFYNSCKQIHLVGEHFILKFIKRQPVFLLC